MFLFSGCNSDDGQHAHDYSERIVEATYLKKAATCQAPAVYYFSCSCGSKGYYTFFHGDVADHSFTQKNTATSYLKKEASCTAAATYYYSCECGERGSTVFTHGGTTSHSFTHKEATYEYLYSSATSSSAARYYYSCVLCGKKGTETFEYGEALKDRWKYEYYIDYQFDEETDDWYIKTTKYLDGSLENLTTEGDPLLVEILYDCNDEITIFLYENENTKNPLKNGTEDMQYYKIVVKNEAEEKYEARGQMHPGSDRIYIIDKYHSTVLKMMKSSEKMKFYLEREDSTAIQYRFEVDMSNFNEVLKEVEKLD